MEIRPLNADVSQAARSQPELAADPTKEAFQDFVGNTLFGQMLSAMRETQNKPAYFHGGQGEDIFRQQLDQILIEEISDASAQSISDPMYELFNAQRY